MAPVALTLLLADLKKPMTSFPVTMERLFGTPMLRICELIASALFQKIEISHLCNAFTTVCSFGSDFLGQEAKVSNELQKANEALEPLFTKQ